MKHPRYFFCTLYLKIIEACWRGLKEFPPVFYMTGAITHVLWEILLLLPHEGAEPYTLLSQDCCLAGWLHSYQWKASSRQVPPRNQRLGKEEAGTLVNQGSWLIGIKSQAVMIKVAHSRCSLLGPVLGSIPERRLVPGSQRWPLSMEEITQDTLPFQDMN